MAKIPQLRNPAHNKAVTGLQAVGNQCNALGNAAFMQRQWCCRLRLNQAFPEHLQIFMRYLPP
jgi:hypothetical protein